MSGGVGGGGTQSAPDPIVVFRNDDYAVNMIRHYDKRVDFNRIVSSGYFVPPFFNHDSCIIQNHRVINDISEKANAILRAGSYEISTILFVVVAAQTNGTSVVTI